METASDNSDADKPKSSGERSQPTTIASPNFDPLAVLYDQSLEIDVASAPPPPLYDNVEACVAAISGGGGVKKKTAAAPPPAVEVRLERKFLPEQMPVSRPRVPERHVLARMAEFRQGPLGRLRELREERVKIKVNIIIRVTYTPAPLFSFCSFV
jgi:hypothetical protein